MDSSLGAYAYARFVAEYNALRRRQGDHEMRHAPWDELSEAQRTAWAGIASATVKEARRLGAAQVRRAGSITLDLSSEALVKLRRHAEDDVKRHQPIAGHPSYTEYVLALIDEVLQLREEVA